MHLSDRQSSGATRVFRAGSGPEQARSGDLSQMPPLESLTAAEVLQLQKAGRDRSRYPARRRSSRLPHVPGSIHIALTGQYASWAARILGVDTRLIIVGEDPNTCASHRLRLARVGVETVVGYLADGVAGWVKNGIELDSIPQITVQDFFELRNQEPDRIAVLDVREPGELPGGAIEKSLCIPLGKTEFTDSELDREKLLVVHCKGGYRSSIATSILRQAGLRDIANLIGGFDAWKTSNH